MTDPTRLEKVQALGFDTIEQADAHAEWLKQNGTPEYKRWLAEIEGQRSC